EEAKREVGIVVDESKAVDTRDTAPALAAAPTVASLRDGKDAGMRQAFINQADAPPCPDCGSIMVRNGACYKCMNCGATSGCS
ncbi:MAG: hypothetical protein ACYDC3_20630, partial [Candidatus Binataceae bacterium]